MLTHVTIQTTIANTERAAKFTLRKEPLKTFPRFNYLIHCI